jgi:hypothetical protein
VFRATDSAASVALPKPVVKIDNSRDPFATVVTVEFGDRLGELLDTVRPVLLAHCFVADSVTVTTNSSVVGNHVRGVVQIQGLKNMGYNISRAKLSEGAKNKFFITNASTSEKVSKSAEVRHPQHNSEL